jgi:hypothetical protein
MKLHVTCINLLNVLLNVILYYNKMKHNTKKRKNIME